MLAAGAHGRGSTVGIVVRGRLFDGAENFEKNVPFVEPVGTLARIQV